MTRLVDNMEKHSLVVRIPNKDDRRQKMIWPIVIFGSIVFLAGTALLFLMTRRRLLKGSALAKIRASWLHAVGQVNPTLKIVEADKVLDEALKLLGYSGSLGDKLKSAGPRFKHQSDHINKIKQFPFQQ